MQCLLGTLLRQSQDIFRGCVSHPERQLLPETPRPTLREGKRRGRGRRGPGLDERRPRLYFPLSWPAATLHMVL